MKKNFILECFIIIIIIIIIIILLLIIWFGLHILECDILHRLNFVLTALSDRHSVQHFIRKALKVCE